MRFRKHVLPFLIAASTAGAAFAQDDLRDKLTRHDGKILTGRVHTPFAKDELVLLQGGKRVRVPRAEIASTDLLADRIREFGERRVRQKDSPKAQWFLVEWARSRELPGLARAQAMLLALDDDGHEQAHEFLGHKKSGKN